MYLPYKNKINRKLTSVQLHIGIEYFNNIESKIHKLTIKMLIIT